MVRDVIFTVNALVKPEWPKRWALLRDLICSRLTSDDDASAWPIIIDRVCSDAEYLCRHNPDSKFVAMTIGCCSHWLRPHQTRWTADGGFAWPTGYVGQRHSRLGLPQHDWDVAVHWHGNEARWQQTDPRSRFKPRQILEFRVSVPARTAWHEQAAVFTIWRPGSPPLPKDELIQFYGFRKRDDVWACTASTGPEGAYDRTAEAVRDGS